VIGNPWGAPAQPWTSSPGAKSNTPAPTSSIVPAKGKPARAPDLIIGSWCGKKFRPERVAARPGFAQIPAVQHQHVYEIKSSLILQPGLAALADDLAALQKIEVIRGLLAPSGSPTPP
jgi:ABC-type Fe3+-hydroxamate transport system substrate-binding protein